jgi:extracellular factor (EF) 3-hydroxypalmitic acid methyl ester biosynthesis protein
MVMEKITPQYTLGVPLKNFMFQNGYASQANSSLLSQINLFYMERLDASIREFIELNSSLTQADAANYLRTATVIHNLLNAILIAEKRISKEEIRTVLAKVREIHRQSPFFVRTQDWPRGYAGDFETIEYIINGENQSPKMSLGYYLEAVILNSPIVQQHRNKVAHQAQLILTKAYEKENPKILSIGCGSSADLRSILPSLQRTNAQVTLFDMDEGALACSAEKLHAIKDNCTFIQGNLIRLVKKIEDQFDLIVIGGVFDYLTDKTITSVLDKIYTQNLLPGGEIFFTNIAKGNPYRTWMEYCFDWELIERTKEDLENIYTKSMLLNSTLHTRKEETGLTYLVNIKNNL